MNHNRNIYITSLCMEPDKKQDAYDGAERLIEYWKANFGKNTQNE